MNMVGNEVPIKLKVAGPFPIHKCEHRKPWVTKPRSGFTFEECITRITFAEDPKKKEG